MTSGPERRYDDAEVAEILTRAADAELDRQPDAGPPDGLTLAELQKVGAEAGLAPDLIARAAAALDARPLSAGRRRMLGVPVGVARTVPLPRPLSQDEWERMVVSFRDTFRARGRVRSDGDLREWSNGNLQALVEPADEGWVLRLSTYKSGSGMIGAGAIMIVVAIALFLPFLLEAGGGDLRASLLLAMVGAAQIGWGALRLPPWAAEREHQFEALGQQALRITARPVKDTL